jgi:hypothetical protein
VHDFGIDFQRSVLRLCMIDEAFNAKAVGYLEPDHFSTPALGWVFKSFRQYTVQFSMRCTDMALRHMVRGLPTDRAGLYSGEAEQLLTIDHVPEAPFIRQTLTDFCRQGVFSIAHRESAALFNEGKHVEAYDVMAKAQDRIVTISFE